MLELRCRYSVSVFQTSETQNHNNSTTNSTTHFNPNSNGSDGERKPEAQPEPEPMDTSQPSETSQNLNNRSTSNSPSEENFQNPARSSTFAQAKSKFRSELGSGLGYGSGSQPGSRVLVVVRESRDWSRVGKLMFQICNSDRSGTVLNNSKPICSTKHEFDKNLPLQSGDTIKMEWINFVGIHERLFVENKPLVRGLNLVKDCTII